MPSNLPTPAPGGGAGSPVELAASGSLAPDFYGGRTSGGGAAVEGKTDWRRYWAAIRRHKWLVLLVTVAGTAAGVGATRFITPQYVAQSTIWIEIVQRGGGLSPGPIRTGQLVSDYGWIDLLKSFVVLDEVVRQERLYLGLENTADSSVLAGFILKDRFVPGTYRVEVDEGGRSFSLTRSTGGAVLQQGAVGDSIGSSMGFAWQPPASALSAGRRIEFSVSAPRDASRALAQNLVPRIGTDGNFMRLELSGGNRPTRDEG